MKFTSLWVHKHLNFSLRFSAQKKIHVDTGSYPAAHLWWGMDPAFGLVQIWGWRSWCHLPWNRHLQGSPGGPRCPATMTSSQESWDKRRDGGASIINKTVNLKGTRMFKALLPCSPDSVDGSLIVSCMYEGIRFDPHRQPVQVGDTLDHIHSHGSHFSSFDWQRKKA